MVGPLPGDLFHGQSALRDTGYTLLEVERENPFYSPGQVLKGHEFHYSRVLSVKEDRVLFCLSVKRGAGIKDQKTEWATRMFWLLIPMSTPWGVRSGLKA